MRWHDNTRTIGVKEHPYLLITISEPTQPPPFVPTKSTRKSIETSDSDNLPKRKRKERKV